MGFGLRFLPFAGVFLACVFTVVPAAFAQREPLGSLPASVNGLFRRRRDMRQLRSTTTLCSRTPTAAPNIQSPRCRTGPGSGSRASRP